MSNIDLSQLITAEDKSRAALAARAGQIKAECSARITSILDMYTVSNLQGAVLAGELSEDDMAIFCAGRKWVEAMLETSRAAITDRQDPVWPEPPEGMADLAGRF